MSERETEIEKGERKRDTEREKERFERERVIEKGLLSESDRHVGRESLI